MEFYIPTFMQGRLQTKADLKLGRPGVPYRFFRGIHAVPEAIANTVEANVLGIKPVAEMTEAEWSSLGYSSAQRAEIMDRHGLIEREVPGAGETVTSEPTTA